MENKIKEILLMVFTFLVGIFIGLHFYKNEDVNHDRKINIKDLLIVQKYILEEGDK